MAVLTQEQAKKVVAEFERQLLPAKLYLDYSSNDPETKQKASQNLKMLAAEAAKRNLEESAANFIAVTNEILFQDKLLWQPGFKPAKLVLYETKDKPEVQKSAQQSEADICARLKIAADRDAQVAKDASTEKAMRSLIGSFLPVFRGRIDYTAQDKVQTSLLAYLEKEKKRGASMSSIKEKVEQYIAKQYEEIEKKEQS